MKISPTPAKLNQQTRKNLEQKKPPTKGTKTTSPEQKTFKENTISEAKRELSPVNESACPQSHYLLIDQ